MEKEQLIKIHKHNIDNNKRMWESESITYECYMENKAMHEKAIKKIEEEIKMKKTKILIEIEKQEEIYKGYDAIFSDTKEKKQRYFKFKDKPKKRKSREIWENIHKLLGIDFNNFDESIRYANFNQKEMMKLENAIIKLNKDKK